MKFVINGDWKDLESAFGDPTKLMQNRKDALLVLESLSKDDTKGGLKTKVEWFLEIEVIIKKEFVNKSNNMYIEAFLPSTFLVHKKLYLQKLYENTR